MLDIENKQVPINGDCNEEKIKENSTPPPPDRFYLVRFMVLFLGLSSLLVQSFVVTANGYWMYKFRNPAMGEEVNANNRTSLQRSFTSSLGVAMAVPTGLGLILALTVAQKIKSRTKINWSYGLILFCFAMLTIFVKVNTDDWQEGFFVLVMLIMGINAGSFVILCSSLIVVTPRLPTSYMKLFMCGQGSGGIFSATLQLICLAVVNKPTSVALIYFSCGTAVYFLSLVLYILTKYSPYFQYYCNENEEQLKRSLPKLQDMKRAFFNMWPILVVMGLVVLTQTTMHPNITSLIVSENYGDQTLWTEKYFVPVITFFCADIANVIGRVFASKHMTRKNYHWFILITLVALFVYPTLFIFCNVKTGGKVHNAVFNHDWQYILILITFVPLTGYMQTVSVLSVPNFRHEQDKSMDLYYLLMQLSMMLLGIATSPLGVVIVNLV